LNCSRSASDHQRAAHCARAAAHDALARARTAALADGATLSEEFVLADLQDARSALEESTGGERATMCSRIFFQSSVLGNDLQKA